MYEIIVQLLQPYTLLLFSLAIAFGLTWRSSAAPRRRMLIFATANLGLISLLSMPLVGNLALRSLERPYPPTVESPDSADTIVVLGGSLITESTAAARVRLGHSTITRCLHAAQMYRQAGGCRMIASGGRMARSLPQISLAAAMRDFLVTLGVRAEDITLEEESATTWENAARIKPLLSQAGASRIWLVTDAVHMRRAENCFRACGIRVTTAPCGHHTLQIEYGVRAFIPSSDGIVRVDQAAHEWLGILWYRLRGRN